MIELYTTLSRFQVQRDEQILEESVDGMDFVAGVLFADAEGRSGTTVTLRLGYYLPGLLSYPCMPSTPLSKLLQILGAGSGG